MVVSLFQIFSIGIGPSSSHTVGPMRAARWFIETIFHNGRLDEVANVRVELFGSLAMTGEGHQTDIAILLGLEGEKPDQVNPAEVTYKVDAILGNCMINLLGMRNISFHTTTDLLFHKGRRLPYHSNAMRFKAFDRDGAELHKQIFYSTGGGFVVDHEQLFTRQTHIDGKQAPYPFKTAEELLSICSKEGKSIAQVMLANEMVHRTQDEVFSGILAIWNVMQASIQRGCQTEGILPGGLEIKRRAPLLRKKLEEKKHRGDSSEVFDWISLYALAVNEENAAGGRVVTAPTNGASGVIPAVVQYYLSFCEKANYEGVIDFFLTAAAIGVLYKEGASFSAAEMGCQGEVGVACSMAAAGLAATFGGSPAQIANAAEIGMEHNLGLTCDPIGGLVQVPCIERNTMGALKAVNAARLALHGDGQHRVSLDQVIAAMYHTGVDMNHRYKETSEGGLAIHVPLSIPLSRVEC